MCVWIISFFVFLSSSLSVKPNSLSLPGNLHLILRRELTTQWWSLQTTQVCASFLITHCPSDHDVTKWISVCSGSESKPSPRLCILKREEGESYGFHLRVEKRRQGHIIRNVASGGVAGRCGLRDGDRLLEVNNCYVGDLPHPEVKAHNTTDPRSYWKHA